MPRKRSEEPNYNPAICEIDHAGQVPLAVIEFLPKTEANPFRWRCAGCAYIAGMNEAGEDIKQLVAQVKALTEENESLRSKLSAQR
jgi:hypothetical protein